MTNKQQLDQIKHNGMVQALHTRIDNLHWELRSNIWEGIKSKGKYTKLTLTISKAENILQDMRDTLVALQELEPENK